MTKKIFIDDDVEDEVDDDVPSVPGGKSFFVVAFFSADQDTINAIPIH